MDRAIPYTAPYPASIGYHPGRNALIAIATDSTGQITGGQFIHLDRDGHKLAKAEAHARPTRRADRHPLARVWAPRQRRLEGSNDPDRRQPTDRACASPLAGHEAGGRHRGRQARDVFARAEDARLISLGLGASRRIAGFPSGLILCREQGLFPAKATCNPALVVLAVPPITSTRGILQVAEAVSGIRMLLARRA